MGRGFLYVANCMSDGYLAFFLGWEGKLEARMNIGVDFLGGETMHI